MIDRDTIIKLAREAGFRTGSYTLSNGEGCVFAHPVSFSDCIPELECFATLVAAAERDACAQIIEKQDVDPGFKHRMACGIRARGNP